MTHTLAHNTASLTDETITTRPLSFYKGLSHGRAPFWMALEWSDDTALKKIIYSDKYDLNEQDTISGQTLAMKLIQRGNLDLLKEIVNSGADLSIRDKSGQTALDYARQMYLTYPQPEERLKQVCSYPALKETYKTIYHFIHREYKKNARLSDLRQSALLALLSIMPKYRHEQIIRKMHKPQTPTQTQIQEIKKEFAYPLAYAILNRWNLTLFRAMCRDKSLQNRTAKGTRYENLLVLAAREKALDYIPALVLLAGKSVLDTDKNNGSAMDVLLKHYKRDRSYLATYAQKMNEKTFAAKKKELKKLRSTLLFLHRQAEIELRHNSLSGNIVGKQAVKYHQLMHSLLQKERI